MVWGRQARAGDSQAPWHRDRAERLVKAVAVGAALLAVPLAVAMGEMNYESQIQDSAEQAASSYQTTAVLQENATNPRYTPGAAAFVGAKVPALATWRAADGSAHEGEVFVEPQLTAGAEVTVWLDDAGQLTEAPAQHGDIVAASVMASLRNLVFVELAILAGYWLTMRLISLVRSNSLDAEWSRTEPKWSHRND